MKKREIHAKLIERNSNFRQFALIKGYQPRTVTKVVERWAGKKHLPRGKMSYQILKDLSLAIGQEITPGILSIEK